MPWYAASAVILTKYLEGEQDHFPVYENVYLVEADSTDLAMEKAAKRAKEEEGDDGETYKCDGRLARRVYLGIRKVIACEDSDDCPQDGTELTYSRMELRSKSDLDKFIQGDEVEVKYEE